MNVLIIVVVVVMVMSVVAGVWAHRQGQIVLGKLNWRLPVSPPPMSLLDSSAGAASLANSVLALRNVSRMREVRSEELTKLTLPVFPAPLTNSGVDERIQQVMGYFKAMESREPPPGEPDFVVGAAQDVLDVVSLGGVVRVGAEAAHLIQAHWQTVGTALIDGKADVAKHLLSAPLYKLAGETFKESFSPFSVAIPNLPIAPIVRTGYQQSKLLAAGQTSWKRAGKDAAIDIGCQFAGGSLAGAIGALIGSLLGPVGTIVGGVVGKIGGAGVGSALGGHFKSRKLRKLQEQVSLLRQESEQWIEASTATLLVDLRSKTAVSAMRYRNSIAAAPRLELIGASTAVQLSAVRSLVGRIKHQLMEQRQQLAASVVPTVSAMHWTVRLFTMNQALNWVSQQTTAQQTALAALDGALLRLPSEELASYDPLGTLELLLKTSLPLNAASLEQEIQQLVISLHEFATSYLGQLQAWWSDEVDRYHRAVNAMTEEVGTATRVFLHECRERRNQIAQLNQEIMQECRELGLKMAS